MQKRRKVASEFKGIGCKPFCPNVARSRIKRNAIEKA